METTINKGELVHTYTGSLIPTLTASSVMSAIFIAVAFFIFEEFNLQFWVVVGFLMLLDAVIFGVMVFQATQIKIIVYEDGLEWQRGTSHAFTSWNNIEAIGRNNEGDSTTYGIYLHETIQPEASDGLSKRFFSAPVEYIRLIPTVVVPTKLKGTDGNVIDWQAFAKTDFGQDILRYAPHLLED